MLLYIEWSLLILSRNLKSEGGGQLSGEELPGQMEQRCKALSQGHA